MAEGEADCPGRSGRANRVDIATERLARSGSHGGSPVYTRSLGLEVWLFQPQIYTDWLRLWPSFFRSRNPSASRPSKVFARLAARLLKPVVRKTVASPS